MYLDDSASNPYNVWAQYIVQVLISPHRLAARTLDSHSSNRGSIPREGTHKKTAHRRGWFFITILYTLDRYIFTNIFEKAKYYI